jgi:DegV family protein with EDD domain
MSDPNYPVALITDSAGDVPAKLREQYDIIMVPMHIIWGTQDLLDQVDIDSDTFYHRLPKDPTHPKTAQPTAQEFLDVINQAKSAGAKEAVVVTISNQMSGTIESVKQAREQADIPIHIVDSLSASMGQGWQVLAAARAREAGGDAQAMVAAADKVRQTLQVIFAVETLEFLHRGGRIGGAVKLVGTALQLKPQLYVDHKTGRVEPGERTRTYKKAVERMYEVFFQKMDTSKPMHIAVLHAAAHEEAEAILARIQNEYKPAELFAFQASPVIGTHAGPGTVGLCGYYEI